MKYLYPIMAMLMVASFVSGQEVKFWGFDDARQSWHGHIWEYELADFSHDSYDEAVSTIINAFEEKTQKQLVPGQSRKAAIKIYTNSGNGLQTPHNLTKSTIQALVDRGFEKENLFIVDVREERLRAAGYLPPLSDRETGPYFDGVRVYALENDPLKDPVWYYDSPLPQEFSTALGKELLQQAPLDPEEARKSYLADELVNGVDFWINLPVACNNPSVGLNGALVNGTLYNVTNGARFFNSPANAPVAVAEIAAIPELKDTWALNILSFERYQYIAGPAFNSLYTRTKPLLWLSVDPVIMDTLLVKELNQGRLEDGFMPLPEVPEMIEYSLQLDLGYGVREQAKMIKVQ